MREERVSPRTTGGKRSSECREFQAKIPPRGWPARGPKLPKYGVQGSSRVFEFGHDIRADKSFDSCRKRQINKSRPMDEDDSKAIFKLANEEQEQADKAFQEEQQRNEDLYSKKLRQGGKAAALKPGSTVQVVFGSSAGFSGTVKKLDRKIGLGVCYGSGEEATGPQAEESWPV
ncbi:hypothetical protein OROHE_013264 [Orobanche hederae]